MVQRRRRVPLLAALGLLALGLLLLVGKGSEWWPGLLGPPLDEPVEEEVHGSVDLTGRVADVGPAGVPEAVPSEAAPSVDTGSGSGVRSQAAPAEEDAPARPVVRVHGIVLDALGRPRPDTTVTLHLDVEWNRTPGSAESWDQDMRDLVIPSGSGGPFPGRSDGPGPRTPGPGGVTIGSGGPGAPGRPVRVLDWNFAGDSITVGTRTDAEGRFDLGECDAVEGMLLRYGHELYLGRPPQADVLLDGLEHVLRLPSEGGEGSLELLLVDPQGVRHPAEVVHARLVAVGEGAGPSPVEPQASQVQVRPTGAELRGLAPGRWRVWARGEHTSMGSGEVLLPAEPRGARVTLELAVLAQPAGPYLEDDLSQLALGEARPDTINGFAEYGVEGQTPRGFGDRRVDGYFRHTFRGFGSGPVRGAWLELELSAHSGASENDGVHLEYQGPGTNRFVWNHRIQDLPGVHGSWRTGEVAHVMLDLSRLPTSEGTLDLRPYLEDGRLDLMVSDDTCVESARLRVLP